MQISTEGTGIPQKAIDGSTSAFYTQETCSLTKSERVPWWYVNLLEPYMVQLVRLDFGKSCCGKLQFGTSAFFCASLWGISCGFFLLNLSNKFTFGESMTNFETNIII